MPRRKMFWFMTVITILAALSMISCGGGDGGPLPQANPTLTGEDGVSGGGGGGGGGVTGACVITVFGGDFCYQPFTQTLCQQTATGMGGTYSWSGAPTTCQSLGYTTCVPSGGYEACM